MHSAPSVEYPAGRSAFSGRIDAALILAWALTQLLWLHQLDWPWPPGAWWFSALAGLALIAATRWRERHPEPGWLRWHQPRGDPPGRWAWSEAGSGRGPREIALIRLSWALDLQHLVLLRLDDAAGRQRWVWLEKRSAPADWDALRRALVHWRDTAQSRHP